MPRLLTCAGICCLLLASVVSADELVFINGDRLTGKVLSVSDEQVKIAADMGGEFIAPLARVQHLSTEEPVSITFSDGRTVVARIVGYSGGVLQLASAEAAATTQAVSQAAATATTGPATTPATTATAAKPAPKVDPAKSGKWRGSISLGATANRGNTDSDLLMGNADLSRRTEDDRIEWKGSYQYGKERDKRTGREYTSIDRWSTAGEYNYFLTEKWYVYAGGSAESDKLKNLEMRLTPGLGVGYQWIETDRTKFNTEGGGNWVYEERNNPDTTDSYMAMRLAWTLEHRLASSIRFIHNFEVLPKVNDVNDYVLRADAGLRFDVTGSIFTELKATVTRDTTPAPGKEDTDVQYRALVGYRF